MEIYVIRELWRSWIEIKWWSHRDNSPSEPIVKTWKQHKMFEKHKIFLLMLNYEIHFQSHLFTWTSYFLSTVVFCFSEIKTEPDRISQSLERFRQNEISIRSFGRCRSVSLCRKVEMWIGRMPSEFNIQQHGGPRRILWESLQVGEFK